MPYCLLNLNTIFTLIIFVITAKILKIKSPSSSCEDPWQSSRAEKQCSAAGPNVSPGEQAPELGSDSQRSGPGSCCNSSWSLLLCHLIRDSTYFVWNALFVQFRSDSYILQNTTFILGRRYSYHHVQFRSDVINKDLNKNNIINRIKMWKWIRSCKR